MNWKRTIIPLIFVISTIFISNSGICDSMKDIEKDLNKLDSEVDKIRKSLETLSNAIISPDASRVIFYLDISSGTPLPNILKIYINDKLEHETTLEGVKKDKKLYIPLDTYFIPGNYEIKVTGSFNGKIIKGKVGKKISLKPGQTGKILITPAVIKGKRILSVKSFN